MQINSVENVNFTLVSAVRRTIGIYDNNNKEKKIFFFQKCLCTSIRDNVLLLNEQNKQQTLDCFQFVSFEGSISLLTMPIVATF